MANVYDALIHFNDISEIVTKHNRLVTLLAKDLSEVVTSGGVGNIRGPANGVTHGNVVLWDGSSGRRLSDSTVSGEWFDQSVTTNDFVDFAGVSVEWDVFASNFMVRASEDYADIVYEAYHPSAVYDFVAKATSDTHYKEYSLDYYNWDDETETYVTTLVRDIDLTNATTRIPLLTVNELTLQAELDNTPVLIIKSEDGKVEHKTTITNAGALSETVATNGGSPVTIRTVNTTTGASTIPTATMSKLYIGTYTLPDDLADLGGGGGGTGYPTQVMTEMIGMTIDDTWRNWSPEDVSFTNNAVYQVWLNVAEGSDMVVATGSFLWSDLPSMIECSCEVPLHQLAYYAHDGMNIYMRTYCDGVNEMVLQIASTSELTAPVVNAKFVRIL